MNRTRSNLTYLSSVTVQTTACGSSFPVVLCASRRFDGTFRLHHLVDPDHEYTSFLWNVNSHLPDHTAPPPVRRLPSLYTDLHVSVDNTSSTTCNVTSLTDVLNEFQNTEIQPGAYRIRCINWNISKWQQKMCAKFNSVCVYAEYWGVVTPVVTFAAGIPHAPSPALYGMSY